MPRVNKQLRRWFKRNHLCAAAAVERHAMKMSCHNSAEFPLCAPVRRGLQIVKVDGGLRPSPRCSPQAKPVQLPIISSHQPICKSRFGAFLSQGKGNLLPSNEEATGVAAGYRHVADFRPVWKPNANDIRGIIGELGRRTLCPDPPLGETRNGVGLRGPNRRHGFGLRGVEVDEVP